MRSTVKALIRSEIKFFSVVNAEKKKQITSEIITLPTK